MKTCIKMAVDLAIAMGIGLAIILPFLLYKGVAVNHEIQITFSSLPHSDSDLKQWYSSNPKVRNVSVDRIGHNVTVRYTSNSIFSKAIWPIWDKIGYRGAVSYESKRKLALRNTAFFFSITILVSQIGFFVVSLFRLRSLAEIRKMFIPASSRWWIIFSGMICGILLFGLGTIHDYTIKGLFGNNLNLHGYWALLKGSSGKDNLLIIIMGVIIAPICEELFFRGWVVRSFIDSGQNTLGYIFSSFLFAIAHVYLSNIVAYFLIGMILAWLYDRTHSLLAPTVAHSINNALAFWLLLK